MNRIDGPIREDFARAIWRVLVEECRAPDSDDARNGFVWYVTQEKIFGHEYRFMGALSFGGKFYNDHFQWRVGYYREHHTAERAEMTRRANDRLTALRQLLIDGKSPP